jgi:drug/metabolite transporter (DMT)-like permease
MHSPATQDDLRRGYLNAAGVMLIWASFIIFSRMSGKTALTAYDVIALRYAVAGIAILPLWWRYRHAQLFEHRKLILTLVGALGFTLFAFNGFRLAPANHAAILLQGFLPFSVAVMAYFLAHEHPTRQRVLGLVLIACGVLAMGVETFHISRQTLLGDGLLVGASLCWALYTVLLRRWKLPPIEATVSVTLLATILYLPIYAAFLPKNIANVPWQISLSFGLFQGTLVAIIQMIFYTRAVHYLGASRLAMMTSIVPVLASLGAVPILGEPLTPAICLGLLFCCAGAWVGNQNKDSTRTRLSFFRSQSRRE